MRQNIDELVEQVRPRLRWNWATASSVSDNIAPPSAVFEGLAWQAKRTYPGRGGFGVGRP